MADVLNQIVGVEPGGALDRLRALRPQAKAHAQGAYEALFEPADASHMSLDERRAVALFTALLHEVEAGAEFYAQGIAPQLAQAVRAEAEAAAGTGPYGSFAHAATAESEPGPVYAPSDDAVAVLGEKLAAGLAHAHLLTLHPRDAAREHMQTLLDAGWTSTGIVTLSQLVAFLSFQLRVAHGLVVLKRVGATAPAVADEDVRTAAAAAQEGDEA